MSMTTTITPDAVVGIKDDFKQFSDDAVKRDIQLGVARANSDGLDNPNGIDNGNIDQIQAVFDGAVLAYARHLMMIDIFAQYNGVTSATTLGNSQTITDKTNNDPYLAEYNRTVTQYGSSNLIKGTVKFYAD